MATQNQKKDVLETAFNSYQLEEVIGEGGTGRVWLAINSDGEKVALKSLKPERVTKETRKRFKNEILFCEQARHASIIRVLDHGSHKTAPFYVMPLLRSSFRELLANADLKKRLVYLGQLLDGVEAAHLHDVTHRDLKPENVLFDSARDRVVVADFGIAHFADEELYTLVETDPDRRLANFVYAAPEQRNRGQKADSRTDVYAIGLMINEAFTGHVPYGTNFATVGSVYPELAWLDDLVAEMIQQRPDQRPESIGAIKRQLERRELSYVTQQRLSVIQNRVIPIGKEDDPLALEPPRVVDFEWKGNQLTLVLDRPVNQQWMAALYNMKGYSNLSNQPPGAFRQNGNRVFVEARERDVQAVIDHFKTWLPIATAIYRDTREQKRKEEVARERQKLQEEHEELERRERLRKNIRL